MDCLDPCDGYLQLDSGKGERKGVGVGWAGRGVGADPQLLHSRGVDACALSEKSVNSV